MRPPPAASIAFAIAGATAMSGVSPAPADGWSGRSMGMTSISGMSLNRGTRYAARLPFVIRLSRHTMGVVRQNIAFSILVKAGFIALTLAGASSLWLAVLADTRTSVLVVLNSLRLLRFSEGKAPAAQARQPVLHRGLAERPDPVYTEAH